MTRLHAAEKLLALGPLMREEFDAITGWPRVECKRILDRLRQHGKAVCGRQHGRRSVWRLR